MTYKHTLALLFLAAISSIGLHILPAYAKTSVTWLGTAEFGTLEIDVTADGTGIKKIAYAFSGWKCGRSPNSEGASLNAQTPFPISDGTFSITVPYSPDRKQELTISGAFESATHAAGTWEAMSYGEVCTGSWEASVQGAAP